MKEGFSRRSFVAGAPGAIAAAPMMAEKAVASLGRVASGFGTSLGNLADAKTSDTMQQAYAGKARYNEIYNNPAVQSLQRQVRKHDQWRYRRDHRRSFCGGFDPDIAFLRSPSMSARLRMQDARDRLSQREGATLANMAEDKIAEIAGSFGINLGERLRRAVEDDDDL